MEAARMKKGLADIEKAEAAEDEEEQKEQLAAARADEAAKQIRTISQQLEELAESIKEKKSQMEQQQAAPASAASGASAPSGLSAASAASVASAVTTFPSHNPSQEPAAPDGALHARSHPRLRTTLSSTPPPPPQTLTHLSYTALPRRRVVAECLPRAYPDPDRTLTLCLTLTPGPVYMAPLSSTTKNPVSSSSGGRALTSLASQHNESKGPRRAEIFGGDEFDVTKSLGKGNFGQVYLAEAGGKLYALKVHSPHSPLAPVLRQHRR